VASLEERDAEANQYSRHAATDVRKSSFLDQPLQRLVGHGIIASIEGPSFQTPFGPNITHNGPCSTEAVYSDGDGLTSDRENCEQPPDLHDEWRISGQPTGRKRRCRLSSPSLVKHAKKSRSKIIREQDARAKQATYLQYMEDLLECVLRWEAPKKQTPRNEAKSGLVGDKQQTMQALCILTEVLIRHTVSPLKSKPGETSLQTIEREARYEIKAHLSDDSANIPPICSLMADHSPLGDQPCARTRDHEPCLPHQISACVECRKQRRGTHFKHNLERLTAEHGKFTASSTDSSPSIHRRESRWTKSISLQDAPVASLLCRR
jgi:hypothetical protein